MTRKLNFKHNDDDVFESDFEFKSVAIDDYTIEMVGSTPAMDRDGESISIDGWDLKNFKNNPVILLNHSYYDLPVAKAESVKVKDGKLVFKIVFPKEGVYGVADTVRRLYKDGFMNASSVGFKPREWTDGNGEKGKPSRTFLKQELLELSLVTVPSNPEALVSAKSLFQRAIEKKIVSESEIEAMEKFFKSQSIEKKLEIIESELSALKFFIDATKLALEEKIKQAFVDETFIQKILDVVENKKFEKGYDDLMFGNAVNDPKHEKNIDDVISAIQNSIKQTIERRNN